MKAIVCERYGSPDVLELQDIGKPAVSGGGVLVRVRAETADLYDGRLMHAEVLWL